MFSNVIICGQVIAYLENITNLEILPYLLHFSEVLKPNCSDLFKKIVKRYIRVGYNLDIMRQSACLVLNPITVYSYGFLFNRTTVGQASDSMTALT